ncbi:hypothetical protein BIV24_28045 [Streptomyces colonosanans]|uniref:Peptidase M24 domain-containing protein n=1 Tax=Streptomyces colonosanans TaxID=1428652 RepID=A0A1S2NW53_9ACTN|nr:hypothetical protein BIV24_28045 [Streptomyces colonosanans]
MLPPGRDATVDAELSVVLNELRLIEGAWEVGQLQFAADHTVAGFEDVVRDLPRVLAHPRGEAEICLDGVSEEGRVLTVEPGLYLQPDDDTLPDQLLGIGVRIEDDLVNTPEGARLTSGALARTPDVIEAWLGELIESR